MLEDLDSDVQVFDLDVTRAEQIAALGHNLGDRPIDVLINNAGIKISGHNGFGSYDDAKWHEVMAVNAFAPVAADRGAGRKCRRQRP